MARLARAVVPGAPHHVLQRGNPGQRIFAAAEDYREYLELVAEGCAKARVTVVGYCLLPKQVHLVLLPPNAKALRNALGEAHRRFTRAVNLRRGRTGGLFRGRFASFPLDKASLPLVMRFVEQAPVRGRAASRQPISVFVGVLTRHSSAPVPTTRSAFRSCARCSGSLKPSHSPSLVAPPARTEITGEGAAAAATCVWQDQVWHSFRALFALPLLLAYEAWRR